VVAFWEARVLQSSILEIPNLFGVSSYKTPLIKPETRTLIYLSLNIPLYNACFCTRGVSGFY